jgi:hypothetical protein
MDKPNTIANASTGMNASIGPACTPTSPPSQPRSEHRLHDPERSRDREQVHHRGLDRDHASEAP